MRKVKRILLAALMLSATSAWAESYLCIAEQSAGFTFNKGQKKWSATTFRAEEKFIIKRPTAKHKTIFKDVAWVVTKFGDSNDFANAACQKDFSDNDSLYCGGFRDFIFSKKTMRFLSTYKFGYVSYIPDDPLMGEDKNTPSMNIGTCSLI